MNTDKHDRLAANGDGEFSNIVRAAIDEIRREEPEEVGVERVIVRALSIPMLSDGTEPSQPTPRKEENMRRSWFARMPVMMKLAAGFLLAAVLIGTGWAAEEIYKRMIQVTLESIPGKSRTLPTVSRTLPDGSIEVTGHTVSVSRTIVTNIDSEDPNALETAKRHHEEMKQLIGERKYEFVKTFQLPGDTIQYVYKFTYADGSHGGMNFSFPLETVASWDEVQQKEDQLAEQRLDEMEQQHKDK